MGEIKMSKLKKREEESREQYISRIYGSKIENGMINKECAELINSELGTSYQESYFRGIHINYTKGFNDGFEKALVDRQAKGRLSEIKEELGELYITKQSVRNDINKLGRLKRDFVKSIDIAEEIKEFIEKEFCDNSMYFNLKPSHYHSMKTMATKDKLIICLSDWHIGYVINSYKGNNYNFEVATDRLASILIEVEKVCNKRGIMEVYVCNLGDIIEGTYMRANQSFDCEFTMSEQIVKATKLLLDFCISVESLGVKVNLVSVGGNHNRMNGVKGGNNEGDNANVIICENIKTILAMTNRNIEIIDCDYKDDSCDFTVNGLRVLAIHGDNRPQDKKKLFDTEEANLILRGHYHCFDISAQDNGGYVLTNGCLFGYNPYSKKIMACMTKPSQALVVIDESGKIDTIKNVVL